MSHLDIRARRVYEEPRPEDGTRVLVDRLWPRGVAKDKADVDLWAKDIAPSDELRRWYGHEEGRWEEFRDRYFGELADKNGPVEELVEKAREGRLTLLFAARDEEHNNAVALKQFLENQMSD